MFEIPFIILSYILLSMQGIGNYLFSFGALSAWKQALIGFIFFYVIIRYFATRAMIPLLCVAISAPLFINTLALGRPIGSTIYNIFFFIGWAPFFACAQAIDFENRPKLGRFLVLLILLSGLGLWLQLTTGLLDFLKYGEAQIRAQTGDAQRFFLVYVTSTGVMPTLAGFYCLALTARIGALWQIIALAGLVVSAIATASLAAFVMLAFSLLMCAVMVKGWERMALIALASVFAVAAPVLQSDEVAKQLERVTGNTATSQSNEGRLRLWYEAASLLATSSPREALLGRGIGTTNDALGAEALYEHGESSYFQAAIEGGLLGLMLRLLPFYLLVVAAASVPGRAMIWLYAIGIVICCAVAPVFALYGLQCGVGMVAGYATGRARRLRSARKLRSLMAHDGAELNRHYAGRAIQ
jgi:hypothetical protein